MAIPVITAPASPRIIAQGVAFSQALTASNTPTSWAATGLPSGLAINTSTGTISGTPLTEEVAAASITATNGDGTSGAVTISFVIVATPPGNGGAFDLELDYELMTNEVRITGIDPPKTGEPLFYAPKGTNRYLLVGILKRGVLQDINPDSEDVAIKIGMKELEPERLLEVTTGATVKVADMTDDRQRYRIPFRVTPGNWTGPLGDYEADEGTIISALAELQVSVGEVAVLHDATLTDSAISIEGNITSPITGDHDFTGIEEFSVATPMRLTLTLSVAGRVLQTVELVREFDLIFTGGAFVLSNLSGPTTGQGAVELSGEGGKWRATLNLTSLAGDADSVDADYSITTTADSTTPYYVWRISPPTFSGDFTDPGSSVDFTTQHLISLQDVTDTIIDDTPLFADTYANPAAYFAAVAAAWETATGVADVVRVDAYDAATIAVHVLSSTAVRKVGCDFSSPAGAYAAANTTPTAPEGASTTCSVTARLEQLEAPESVPLNLTSNLFRIGVARDMVPD
jgi:hypothetical protein